MIPKKNCYLLCKNVVFTLLLLSVLAFLYLYLQPTLKNQVSDKNDNESKELLDLNHRNWTRSVVDRPRSLLKDMEADQGSGNFSVLDQVHVFYYPWYGNPEEDSGYIHWNHEYLPNWDKQDSKVYPTGRHQPPDDIGANFYPQLGCYSSKSAKTVDQHMKWIKEAGIGVLVVSWYPPNLSDKEGKPFDKLFPLFLDTANLYGLKISFHIEPYEGRTPENLKQNIEYIIQKYGNHSSLYKLPRSPSRKPLPVFYIYDSYLNAPNSWSAVLSTGGKHSIRNTELDGVFLGLIVELRHK